MLRSSITRLFSGSHPSHHQTRSESQVLNEEINETDDQVQNSITSISERDLDVAARLVADQKINSLTQEEDDRIRRKIDLNCDEML